MGGKHSGAERQLSSSELWSRQGIPEWAPFWGAQQRRALGRRREDRPLKPQKSEGWKIQAL